MPSTPALRPDVELRVERALRQKACVVLAVSGGLDSMVLLEAAARVRGRARARVLVASFDHGSGRHATRATAHVARHALSLGLPVVTGSTAAAPEARWTEDRWRAARWGFLREVAARVGGVIATAHTRDDQVETVLMRVMRGAGARGLAALAARSHVLRPLLGCTRRDLQEYADRYRVRWVEDPSNRDRRFLRNRIRHDLLPALRCVQPTIDQELIDIGERAARWRASVAEVVDRDVRHRLRGPHRAIDDTVLDVFTADLAGRDAEALAVLWQELAARAGVTLDRRGTERLAQFTTMGRSGARIQLAGGWEVLRARDRFQLRRAPSDAGVMAVLPLALEGSVTWGRWSFLPTADEAPRLLDPWMSRLPADKSLRVRAWRAGDTMTFRLGERLLTRKVKYYLSDAGISGHQRATWPVVEAGDEIVWIPGVRRSDAATVRSGGPTLTYVCDYDDR